MTMMRWEPFREMITLRQAMDRLFEDSFVRPVRVWPELGVGEMAVDMVSDRQRRCGKGCVPRGQA